MWKTGDVEVPNRVAIAPMTGISNTAFRVTIKEFGAGLVVCEIISGKGIKLRNKKTLEVLYIDEREYPLSVQTFGGDREALVETAKFVEENTQAVIIDINMGCPVSRIIRAEAGAEWLLDPNKVYEMVCVVSSVVFLSVTVKMRTGWDEDHPYAVDNALAAKQAGVSATAMYGRTCVQMYEGTTNWDVLKEVKKHLAIPLMGNGDVEMPKDAKRVLEYVGADSVIIGQAALGNPWMIQQTKECLETGELMPRPSPTERINTAKIYLQRLVDLKDEKIVVREFRRHASYYLKGISQAAKAKVAISQVETQQAVVDLFDAFVEEISKVAITTIGE